MIRHLIRLAYHLDEWLQETLGRPYNALLGVGLVLGLIHQVQDLPKELTHSGGMSTMLIAVMDVALLINQAGQFHQHMERRRAMPRRRLLRRPGKALAAEPERVEAEAAPKRIPTVQGGDPPPTS